MTYEMSDLFEHLVIVPIFPTKVLSPSDELSLALRHQIAGFPNLGWHHPPRCTSTRPAGS